MICRKYFLEQLILVFLILNMLSGCVIGSEIQTPDHPPQFTSIPSNTPTSLELDGFTPSSEDTPTPIFTPSAQSNTYYRRIDPGEVNLLFTQDTVPTPGSYLVVSNETYTNDSELISKVVTESGSLISNIKISIQSSNFNNWSLYIYPIPYGSTLLPMRFTATGIPNQIYIYDIQTTHVFGIETTCGKLVGLEVSSEFVAFSCQEEMNTWQFVSLSDPSALYIISSPISIHSFEYRPIWFSNQEVLFVSKDAFCVGSIVDWDPVCGSESFLPGALGVEQELLEIRIAYPYDPTSIGAVSLTCLRSGFRGCEPITISDPFTNDDISTVLPLGSAWVPGVTDIIYTRVVDFDLSTFAADQTELWLASYPEGTIEKLAVLDGEIFLTELGFENAPAIWLENGKDLVLNKLDDLIIYNIETGETRSIGYPGRVLGAITIE